MHRVALLTGIILSSVSLADGTDKALDQLFKVMNMEKMQDASIQNIVDVQVQQNPALGAIKPEFLKFMKDNVGWKALEKDVRGLYAKTFTEAEVKQLIAFYESPVGKKSITEMPRLLAEGMKLGQTKIQAKLPAFLKSIEGKMKSAQPQK